MRTLAIAAIFCTALAGCETGGGNGEITDPQIEADTPAGRDLGSRHNADGHHHHDHEHGGNGHNGDGHHHHAHDHSGGDHNHDDHHHHAHHH
ncbi:hypothetical protein KHP62_01995 [Rhodobacteraceae bacterium NNCM2]|nr:hypothetical protein [Coraliihabitans acroporae]